MEHTSTKNRALPWVLIAIVAIIARLGMSAAVAPDWEWSDAGAYDSIALNLLDGNGFSVDGHTPTRIRPPGYPVLVAAVYAFTGRDLYAVVFVQVLLGTGTALLAGWLASRLFGRGAGYLAALIAAGYPALMYYDTRILREGFTAFLVTASVCAAYRTRWGAWSRRTGLAITGSLVALASLCRPETAVILLPISVILAARESGGHGLTRTLAVLSTIMLLFWMPWTLRNIVQFGDPSPVRDGLGSVVWFGSRWAESGGDDQTSASRHDLQGRTFALREGLDPRDWESRFLGSTVQDILGRPLWFAEMVGRKAVMFWKDANGVKRTLPRIHPALPIALNIYYYSLLLFALAGLTYRFRESTELRALGFTILVYFGTYALLHVRNRYRVPLLPLVFVLSSGGLHVVIEWARQRAVRPHATGRSETPVHVESGNGVPVFAREVTR